MKRTLKKCNEWLLPVLLILFIAEAIVFPIALGITYADRSENPNHVLNYKKGSLTWKHVRGITEKGVAKLDIFDNKYQSTISKDDKSIVAPGTKGTNIIRLKNDSLDTIHFTAVLYVKKTNKKLPINVVLKEGNYMDTDNFDLPEGEKGVEVIRAVKGSLEKKRINDFDISWSWKYRVDENEDKKDSYFGDEAAIGNADEIDVGFYIVVEDNGMKHHPKTGDNSEVWIYINLMIASLILFMTYFITKKREGNA